MFILEGKLTFKQALGQAKKLSDPIERKCATDILIASRQFLQEEPRSIRVGLFPAMSIDLPNGVELDVSPVWLRHLSPNRLMILHFWQTPLSERQLSAAAAVLRTAGAAHAQQRASIGQVFQSRDCRLRTQISPSRGKVMLSPERLDRI